MNLIQRLRNVRRNAVKRSGRSLLQIAGKLMARQSLIGDQPVFDKAVFPWTAELETNWMKIRAELDEVMKTRDQLPSFHQLSPDQRRISKDDNWKTFVFYVFGDRFDPNCKRCPETAQLLDRLPRLRNAWFSILAPHYHIPPHRGPTKGVVRIHLGLIVPGDRQNCWIRVDNEILHWDEGRCVVFDDFFEHEVRNDTDQLRAVLFVDVDRPMRPMGTMINKLLIAGIKHSAYVKEAKKNMLDWERNHPAAPGTGPAA